MTKFKIADTVFPDTAKNLVENSELPLVLLEEWAGEYDVYLFDFADLVCLPEWMLPYVQSTKAWTLTIAVDTMMPEEERDAIDRNLYYREIKKLYKIVNKLSRRDTKCKKGEK